MARTLTVDIRLDGIEIDGRLHEYPIPLADLAALFDEDPLRIEGSRSSRTSSNWWWRKSGLSATHTDGVHAVGLKFEVAEPAHRVLIEGRPFDTEFGPQGPTYTHLDFGKGYLMARRSDPGPDQHVRTIIVEQKVRKPKAKPAAKPAKTAATVTRTDGVRFTDVNFKMLVLQDLMYRQRLLTPAFDVNEFVEGHTGRDIDLNEEGYEPIPEVLAYFAEYPVPRDLLDKVVELDQDGGNEIYLQIAPLWGGEDDFFDIKDFSDVDLLPNLRTLRVGGVDEATLQALRAKGIDADLL